MRMLTLSVVLGIVQIISASHAASLQRGCRWTASPRDEKVEPLRGVAGRLERALRNFGETFLDPLLGRGRSWFEAARYEGWRQATSARDLRSRGRKKTPIRFGITP